MNDPIEHGRAFELLPWLVNGRLEAAERDVVEAHLRNCLACRREVKEQQRLRTALREHPAVHISPQTSFERLARRLAEPPGAPARPATRPGTAFARYAAAAAAGLALVAVLFWMVPHQTEPVAPYRTLAAPAAGGGARVDIVFAESATPADRESLLAEIGGEVAAGPSHVGRYTVHLDAAHSSDADVANVLKRLNKDARVRFAGLSLAPEDAR